jgi:hypothetical protein
VVTGRREIENFLPPLKISAAEDDPRTPRRATYNDPSKPGNTLLLEALPSISPPLPSPLSSSLPSPLAFALDDDDEEEDACTNALPVSNDHKNCPVFESTADTEPSSVATNSLSLDEKEISVPSPRESSLLLSLLLFVVALLLSFATTTSTTLKRRRKKQQKRTGSIDRILPLLSRNARFFVFDDKASSR